MKKTKLIALFIIGIICLGNVTISAGNNLLDYHESKFLTYLEKNSNRKISVETIVKNYYKDPENKKISEDLMKQEQNNDYNVYKVIKMNNSDITLYNNGMFSIDRVSETQDKIDTQGNSFKTVTNNWTLKTAIGMDAVTHNFKAKFGYNKKKAWIVPRSAVGKTYDHWIHRVQSKEISGWDTAAHSRTARMNVVECEEYLGIKVNYVRTDTRVGVTKTGKAYTSHKIAYGV